MLFAIISVPGMLIHQIDTQKEMLSLSFQNKKDINDSFILRNS